jgi:hypothetical protein
MKFFLVVSRRKMRGTIASQGWTVKLILVRGNKKELKKGGGIFIFDREESKD